MQGKYNFIKFEKIILRNFSLYKKNGKIYEVNEEINDGVYCLAGANGLGKTTFLNAINYGLTGIVLEPGKEVYSPGEIINANKRYTERYFIGRISKKEEKKAEIEILFKVNKKYFRIIRGFSERDELRLLEIFCIFNGEIVSQFKNKNYGPKELNNYYQKSLSAEIGFVNFDYFIFYQLYVLTFDENRRIIFWDDRASSHALAIAFNTSPNDAERILDLTRKMEKHESNARNLKWESTKALKNIEELTDKIKGKKVSDIEKLQSEYNKLNKESEKIEKIYNNIGIEYDSMLNKQSHLYAEIMQYKNEHAKLFSRYSRPRSHLLENTNIRLSIKRQECCLCGTKGTHIVESIERSIYKDKCPLCNTIINESNNVEQNKIMRLIEKNDQKIFSKNSELDNLIIEIEGKKNERDKTEIELNKIKEKLENLIDDNPDISFIGPDNKSIKSLISQYKKQSDLALEGAKEEYKKRDKLKPEHEILFKKIEVAYKDAEILFVPIFKKLAKSFIGLDLNIRLSRSNKAIKLILVVQDTARTESFQLSESQRFFLDIALRMSLAIFLSNKNNSATMIIDTPEGSLDIAYESRVGNMFAEYVKTYNQNLFMTANINASQLLVSLAEKCGKRKMAFKKMLDWTDLSEIQREGEQLFRKVYTQIDKALGK